MYNQPNSKRKRLVKESKDCLGPQECHRDKSMGFFEDP